MGPQCADHQHSVYNHLSAASTGELGLFRHHQSSTHKPAAKNSARLATFARLETKAY